MSAEKNGKVWLVGAGPGDRGLFTLKGLEVLSDADVVVYDALVGDGVLSLIPDGAELINVGKRSGNHIMPQEEINRTLLREAEKGKKVVRLKGGDPFLFGRGGEELELLTEKGIPYEVVPGVTSAFAVPAYNGIPVTHRDHCSSVHIITGHRRKGEEYDIDFEALKNTGGTLIFLMGVKSLPEICNGLLHAGMDAKTPAAVLEKGTTAGQKRVVSTLGNLEKAAEEAKIGTPAIILVGTVCSLSENFAWAEKRPLSGQKILLTRPKDLSSETAAMLRRKGAEVLELPAIKTVAIEPNEKLKACFEDWEEKGYDWLVFTSPTGVKVFFDAWLKEHDIRALASAKIAAIGRGTEKALKERGIKSDFLPSVYDGETLGKELREKLESGERVLIPRASIGGQELIEELNKAEGIEIDDLPTYDTIYEKSETIDIGEELLSGSISWVVFTSASTVKGFKEAVGEIDFSKVKAVCIGRQTRAAADALGIKTWMSEKATMESLVQKVVEVASV